MGDGLFEFFETRAVFRHKLLVVAARRDKQVHDGEKKGGIGARLDGYPDVRFGCGCGKTGIEDDEFGAVGQAGEKLFDVADMDVFTDMGPD